MSLNIILFQKRAVLMAHQEERLFLHYSEKDTTPIGVNVNCLKWMP